MFDLYQEITDRIIAQLDQGEIPWLNPWVAAGAAIKHTSGEPYSLLNQMLLGRPGEWLTFKQVQREGGVVRKGEKSRIVVFWKWVEQKDDETGEVKKIPFLRYYSVFHIDQCDGIEAKHTKPMPDVVKPEEKAETVVSDYVGRSGVLLMHQEGDRAFYQPTSDKVVIPLMEQFKEVAEYYSTLFHELTHSTGHEKRLNRIAKVAGFGTEEYSKEELVAEIGAAALNSHCGLETAESFRNSAAYVQSWIKALKNDKRMIVSASGRAEKAVNLILGAENAA